MEIHSLILLGTAYVTSSYGFSVCVRFDQRTDTQSAGILSTSLCVTPVIVRLSVSGWCLQTGNIGFYVVWVCADGENNRGTGSRGLGVQPRLDQLCGFPATKQPERGGEAAVVVPGDQLDAPTVSANNQWLKS